MNLKLILFSHKEALKKINCGSVTGLMAINRLSEEIFLRDDQYAEDRNILGKSRKNVDLVIRAVLLREFPSQKNIGWDKYRSLLLSAGRKEELCRQMILGFLNKGVNFGLEPFEVEILRTACESGHIYDDFCLIWREDVMNNPLNMMAITNKLTNKFSVIRTLDDGTLIQIPYAKVYEKQTAELVNRWRVLAKKLANYKNNQAIGLAEYFLSYADAMTDTNLQTVEESWIGVSRVWMKKVTGRIQPIHAEESSYYDENSLRVFPDFRLSIKITSLEKDMKKTQKSLKKYLDKYFGHTKIYQSSVPALDMVQLYPITDVVYCGSFDFQPAGQSLPNYDVVQKKYGTKVFLNGEVINSRWQIAIDLAKKVFSKDISYFEKVDPDFDGTAVMVAGHEYGEPLFTDTSLVEALGADVEALLNEDIATLCISAIMMDRFKSKSLTRQAYVNHAIDLLGSYLRYIDTSRDVPYLQPYYVGMCLLGLRRMLDCGFIYKINSDWRIDESKLDQLYSMTLADMYQQVAIAETKSYTRAKQYLAYAVETNEIMDLIRLVNPNATFSSKKKS